VHGVGLVYEETGGQIRVYHYDQRGNTVALSDSNGAISGAATYGPFGEVAGRTGRTDTPFLFGGLFGVITDPNGLNYMRFRWYSPQVKRFLNEDAHFGEIGDPASLNRYVFAANDPINFSDPTGEFPFLLGSALAGAGINVVATLVTRGIDAAIKGKPFVEKGKERQFFGELVGAAVGGALGGLGAAAIVTCGPACASSAVGLGAAVGGVSSAAGNLTKQLIGGEPFDATDFAVETAFGFAFGLATTGKGAKAAINAAKESAEQAAKTANARAMQQYIRRLSITAVKGRKPPKPPVQVAEYLSPPFKLEAGSTSLDVLVNSLQNALTAFTVGAAKCASSPCIPPWSASPKHSVRDSGRREAVSGVRARFGEFIHWDIYVSSHRLAGRPLPNNPNNLLTVF
jgi:RHS repeat-associated protein